ncbi:MAG TPA: hypothetical protein VI756_01650 [Blastocatellia bacterium]
MKATAVHVRFRRTFSIACLVWMGFGGLGLQATAGLRSDGTKIDLPESRHDFGDVFKGEAVSHTFHIRNAGLSVLQLSDTPPPQPKKKPAPAVGLSTPGPVQPGLLAAPAAFIRGGSAGLTEMLLEPLSPAPS